MRHVVQRFTKLKYFHQSIIQTTAKRQSSTTTTTTTTTSAVMEERDIAQHLEDLEEKGFTLVPDIFTPEELKQLKEDYLNIKERTCEIMATFPPRPRVWEEAGMAFLVNYRNPQF